MPPSALLRRFLCCSASSSSSAAVAPFVLDPVARKKKLVFMGSPQASAPVLDALMNAAQAPGFTFQLAAIVTQPPAARARGRKLMPSPVAQHDVVIPPVSHFDASSSWRGELLVQFEGFESGSMYYGCIWEYSAHEVS